MVCVFAFVFVFLIFVPDGIYDTIQEKNFSGDTKGASQGTKLIKNIPTFKIEHWNIIELKL